MCVRVCVHPDIVERGRSEGVKPCERSNRGDTTLYSTPETKWRAAATLLQCITSDIEDSIDISRKP